LLQYGSGVSKNKKGSGWKKKVRDRTNTII